MLGSSRDAWEGGRTMVMLPVQRAALVAGFVPSQLMLEALVVDAAVSKVLLISTESGDRVSLRTFSASMCTSAVVMAVTVTAGSSAGGGTSPSATAAAPPPLT